MTSPTRGTLVRVQERSGHVTLHVSRTHPKRPETAGNRCEPLTVSFLGYLQVFLFETRSRRLRLKVVVSPVRVRGLATRKSPAFGAFSCPSKLQSSGALPVVTTTLGHETVHTALVPLPLSCSGASRTSRSNALANAGRTTAGPAARWHVACSGENRPPCESRLSSSPPRSRRVP